MFLFHEQPTGCSCFQMHVCSSVCSCHAAAKLILRVKTATRRGSTICTHLNPESHSVYVITKSWLLYSCCLHLQLDTTNHLLLSEFIAGHRTESTLQSQSDNPYCKHCSYPCSFFSTSTAFDITNELQTVCKRGWLFWNSLFQESHNQRGAVEKSTSQFPFSSSLFKIELQRLKELARCHELQWKYYVGITKLNAFIILYWIQ